MTKGITSCGTAGGKEMSVLGLGQRIESFDSRIQSRSRKRNRNELKRRIQGFRGFSKRQFVVGTKLSIHIDDSHMGRSHYREEVFNDSLGVDRVGCRYPCEKGVLIPPYCENIRGGSSKERRGRV